MSFDKFWNATPQNVWLNLHLHSTNVQQIKVAKLYTTLLKYFKQMFSNGGKVIHFHRTSNYASPCAPWRLSVKTGVPCMEKDEPLHAHVTASNPESVKKAVDRV
ncbi:unnamed protein product, partial [Meganyctiphanes norvegica]